MKIRRRTIAQSAAKNPDQRDQAVPLQRRFKIEHGHIVGNQYNGQNDEYNADRLIHLLKG